MDASELRARRLNAKEVSQPQRSGNFIFPLADGTVKIFGREQRLRISTLTRERREQREEQEILRGKSDELHSPTPLREDSTRDDEEGKSDFWSTKGEFIDRHHVEPRVKLCVPTEESFSFPLEYIDVTRTTDTNLDVNLEKRIDVYWNIDGSRDLSDPRTGFTQFTLLEEKLPDGYMWSGERLKRKQLTSRPDHLWPELWERMPS